MHKKDGWQHVDSWLYIFCSASVLSKSLVGENKTFLDVPQQGSCRSWPPSMPAWNPCIKQKVWIRTHPFPEEVYRYLCASLRRCNKFADVPASQWCSFSTFIVQVITPAQLSSFSALLWPASTMFCTSSRQREDYYSPLLSFVIYPGHSPLYQWC